MVLKNKELSDFKRTEIGKLNRAPKGDPGFNQSSYNSQLFR